MTDRQRHGWMHGAHRIASVELARGKDDVAVLYADARWCTSACEIVHLDVRDGVSCHPTPTAEQLRGPLMCSSLQQTANCRVRMAAAFQSYGAERRHLSSTSSIGPLRT
eukprot:CAMPEP_0119369524 /NCGR_PEP_ID=MMETSP1334-20130426/16023_1 /TAXON_ID=127549 /ORGANISM="Calcidiscus leptoporus, Strain RCC1130" /LENGTH=108 /DNA_ID=CAMNT_0007386383 /DNA_START=227 /DNA_END=554 /DNA_ORIENTATION=-